MKYHLYFYDWGLSIRQPSSLMMIRRNITMSNEEMDFNNTTEVHGLLKMWIIIFGLFHERFILTIVGINICI